MVFEVFVKSLATPIGIDVEFVLKILQPKFDSLEHRSDARSDLLPEVSSGQRHAHQQTCQCTKKYAQRDHHLYGLPT
jgi:hypothetical protein